MKLRIATIYTELGFGGDENRLLAFARSLDRSRFEHLVVTLVPSDAASEAQTGPMAAHYRDAGIRTICLGERRRADYPRLPQPLAAARDGARTLRIALKLARLLRRERIDVVDARMTYNMVVGLLAARLARVPVAIATEYYDPWWQQRPWRWLAPAIFDGFDAFITDSYWVLERYRQDLGVSLRGGVVIRNGLAEPKSGRSRDEVRAALGLPGEARVVGQVARIVRYKGQLQLIRAAAEVSAHARDVYFLVCGYAGGDPEYAARLRSEAAALGIADRVRITPWPGPIADVWRAIDIHVHPSLLDSSPIAIHESMALGLPAVVSSAGGIPELVAHEATGLVVPPDDTPALSAAILRLLQEPRTAAALGAAARRRYLERHRPEQMTRALEALIARLHARKHGPATGETALAVAGG
jgi:glycosyltransferase involved in cell wall biosynthesis